MVLPLLDPFLSLLWELVGAAEDEDAVTEPVADDAASLLSDDAELFLGVLLLSLLLLLLLLLSLLLLLLLGVAAGAWLDLLSCAAVVVAGAGEFAADVVVFGEGA